MSNSLISDKKINCSRQAELILSVSHPISVHLRGSALMRCVKQTSIHLNENFVIQWILIGNLFCIYRTFETPDIPLGWVIVGILIALTTGLILYVHLKNRTVSSIPQINRGK